MDQDKVKPKMLFGVLSILFFYIFVVLFLIAMTDKVFQAIEETIVDLLINLFQIHLSGWDYLGIYIGLIHLINIIGITLGILGLIKKHRYALIGVLLNVVILGIILINRII